MWISTKQKNNYVLTLRRRLTNLEKAFGVKSDAYQSYEANLYAAFGRNAIEKTESGKLKIKTTEISNATMANNITSLLNKTPTVRDIIKKYKDAYSKETPEIKAKFKNVKEYAISIERAKGDLTKLLYRYYEKYSTKLPKKIDYLYNERNNWSEINGSIDYLQNILHGGVKPDDYKNL